MSTLIVPNVRRAIARQGPQSALPTPDPIRLGPDDAVGRDEGGGAARGVGGSAASLWTEVVALIASDDVAVGGFFYQVIESYSDPGIRDMVAASELEKVSQLKPPC